MFMSELIEWAEFGEDKYMSLMIILLIRQKRKRSWWRIIPLLIREKIFGGSF